MSVLLIDNYRATIIVNTSFNTFTKSVLTFGFLQILFVCLFINVSAQEKTFSDEDLQDLEDKAAFALGTKPRISTSIFERRYDDMAKQPYIIKTTTKFASPDRRHKIVETKDSDGVNLEEWVYIEDRTFYKYNNEDWQLIENIMGFNTPLGSKRFDKKNRLTENVFINGQKADLYESTYKTKFELPDGTEIFEVNEQRYWFGKEGLFLKAESKTYDKDTESTEYLTADFDYTTKFKINTPNVKSSKSAKPNGKSIIGKTAAQDKTFKVNKLEKLQQNAEKMLENLKYTSTETTEHFLKEGSPDNYKSEKIIRSIPPSREYKKVESIRNGETFIDETIIIDNVQYNRSDDEDWRSRNTEDEKLGDTIYLGSVETGIRVVPMIEYRFDKTNQGDLYEIKKSGQTNLENRILPIIDIGLIPKDYL